MRTWLKIWAIPFAFLVMWLVLASNDWNLGTHFFSRAAFDEFLNVYSGILGVEPSDLPSLLGKALIFDGSLIGAFIAFRKRKVLMPYLASLVHPAMERFAR